MKKLRIAIPIIAAAWILIAVVAATAAKVRTQVSSKPLIVKGNSPVVFPALRTVAPIPWNGIPTDVECEVHYQSFSGGPTNMALQSYFVEVARAGASLYILSNSVAATTSNYLVADPDWFDGDADVALNTAESAWTSVNFKLNGAAMASNNVSDAGMLFIGKAESAGTNYDSGYTFAVQHQTEGMTNFWLPVASSAEQSTNDPAFRPGEEETLWIYSENMTNTIGTNLTLKSYFAKVMATTNGTFQLTNISANLTSAWFETNNTNYYKGQATIPLQTNGITSVLFKLKAQKFIDAEIPDCMLVFVGVSSNTNAKCQIAYVYPVDSPYEPEETKKSEKKESEKSKDSEKPKKDKK